MRGRPSTILAVLSLLLCIASAAMWVRSIAYDDEIRYRRYPRGFAVESECGYIRLSYQSYYFRPISWTSGWHRGSTERAWYGHRFPGVLGFSCRFGNQVYADSPPWRPVFFLGCVTVPYWSTTAVSLVLPCIWWRKQRKRRPEGRCTHCGYDLRASKDRCPECGTPIPSRQIPAPK